MHDFGVYLRGFMPGVVISHPNNINLLFRLGKMAVILDFTYIARSIRCFLATLVIGNAPVTLSRIMMAN